MKLTAKYLALSVAFFISLQFSVSAQDFSNRGKEFWIAYPAHIDGTGSVMGIYITASKNTTGQVNAAGTIIPFTITANQVSRVFLGGTGNPTNSVVYLNMQDGIKSNAAIRITANDEIVVYTHIIRSARSGATLALPTPVLGIEYIVPNYGSITSSGGTGNGSQGGLSQFSIVATQANTVVEITPKANGIAGRPSGVPYQITLPSAGDCYQFQSSLLGDLSGTTIKSISSGGGGCKPIAVFSGSTWTTLDCAGASGGDNLYQQIFPNRSWGKQFVTAPFTNRPSDIYRIYVQDPSTIVTYTENGITNTFGPGQYNTNGRFYQHKTANPLFISGDKPIQVVQYITSQNCKASCPVGSNNPTCFADPEMVVLNSIEQTLDTITFFSAHQNYVPVNQTNVVNHFVNIIINRNFKNTVRIDGAVPNGTFVDIPGTNYSYLQEDLSISSGINPVHRVIADTGFSAIVYGFGSVESYGYNGGTNVKDLSQFVSTTNQFATVNSPVACKSSPFLFAITLPYIPLSIDWTIPGYPNYINNSPVPDSTYISNGKQLYVFRVPGSYVYNAIGTYQVSVTVNNPTPDGCAGIQTIPFPLQVFNPPTHSFTINSKGCVDSAIVFTTNNNGQGRPVVKHYWAFGDNTFSSSNNPVKAFTAPGQYNVRYAIMTDIGCLSDTISLPITVTNTPAAKLGFTNPQCQGKQITFGDTSTLSGNYGSIVNWNWNLGNGTILNNTNSNSVTTTYPNTISYTASLQVRTNTGCLSPLFSLPVTINPNPVPNFTNLYACLPDGVVNFTGTSTIADGTQNQFTYLWNFGDLPSGPLNSSLIKDPSHKYFTTGPYSVKLRVTSNRGCIDSVTRSIANIYPQPKTDFNGPAEVCYQTPVTFTDQTNGITHPVNRWEWRFKDALGNVIGSSTQRNPVYNFPAPGTYFVQHWAFSNQNCVSDTVQKQIIINPWPTAAFSLSTPACERNQVTLTNNSVANAGTLVRWYWNLGDGTIINATNGNPITHTYTNWGNKPIKILVESSKGCLSDTLRQPILINPLPRIGYRLPEVCLNDGFATFNDTSGIPDGSASQLQYLWTFNTGTIPVTPAPTPLTSTLKNPVIQFFTAADYQLNLKVESKDGCKDSVNNIPFTVNGVIARTDFQILPTNGLCSNREVEIQNKSTVSFGWLTKVEIYWDWTNSPTQVEVDDVPLVNEIYKHQYPNFQTPLTRTFRIRLRAFSGIICEKDTVQDIIINASPLTQFDPMTGICVDAVPRQITQAVETGGLPGTGVFSGPGVNSSGLFNPASAGVGTHIIRYTFTASNGCMHYSEQTIEVWPRPAAKLNTFLPNCEKNAITFNSTGSVSNATNLTGWQWNFGDGSPIVSTASNTPVNHIYNAYGNYTVNLVVTNNRGCNSLPEPLNIKVNPLPIVNFSLPKICLPDGTGQFTDLSTIPDNTQSSFIYKWDFGDNFVSPANSDTSNLKNPVYKYNNLGPYTVKLIVTSNNNCVDSLPKQLVDVFPQPKAQFSTSADSICIGQSIDFTDESDGIVSNIDKWKWSFGNGDSSFIENPRYRYPNAATVPYSVKLYVYSDQGCVSDTAEKLIDVWAYPVVSAGPDFTMLQDGIRVISDARATGTGLQFLWSPATYLNNVTMLNPSIVKPQDDITYLLTVTGRGGCAKDDEVNVKILKTPNPPNTFTPNGDGINDFWEIKYLNDYPGCIIEVYNTAGTLMYRSTGYSTPWDGKYKGQTLPAGTYYYVIDPKNGRSRIAGYITILR